MMGGYYAPHGGYGPPRHPRGLDNRHYHTQGPSPRIPATILGVIVLITGIPYMRTPDATVACCTAVRPSSRFPGAVLWIPVLGVIALQFFGGPWYHGYGQAYGRHGTMRAPGMFDINQQRGVMSTFMDYGGHWLLTFLGIAMFTLVSVSSVSSTPVSLAPHCRR